MMSEWKRRARLMVLSCWMLLFAVPVQAEPVDQVQELSASAVQVAPASEVQAAPVSEVQAAPASAVQAAPASAVQAVPTPAEDYEAGVKADAKGDAMGALTLYKQAADAGYAQAQARYADRVNMAQLTSEALKYFRMSVQQGNRDGQYGLGVMYTKGEGVKQDFGVARFLFGLAAEQGQREASVGLADAYIKGQAGLDETERQGPEALAAIRRAAGFDHLPALDALAVAYREGKFGLTADPDQADVIVAITNKMRGIVVKEKEKSALFKLLKGDPAKKKADKPKK